MLKHIIHLIFFAAGAGVGIWWGADHPSDAAKVAAMEQAKVQQAVAVATAKKEVLQKVVADQTESAAAPTATPKTSERLSTYQKMLNEADKEFNSAKASQTTP